VAGITCNFNPNTITPGSSHNFSTLTISASASAPGGGYGGHPGMLLFTGLGVLGMLFATGRRSPVNGKSLMLIALLALLTAGTAFTVGCGNYSNHSPNNNHATVTVTGTAAGIRHSVPVTVTIQ